MEPDKLVFVVDDDAPLRDSLADLLHSVGLRVEAFASAQEFLHSKRPDVPSCLVLDVRLKGLSGLDLQKRLVEGDIEYSDHLHHWARRHPDGSSSDEGRSSGVLTQAFP